MIPNGFDAVYLSKHLLIWTIVSLDWSVLMAKAKGLNTPKNRDTARLLRHHVSFFDHESCKTFDLWCSCGGKCVFRLLHWLLMFLEWVLILVLIK